MSTKVIMPQLGESVVEGTVSRWLKAEGDTINEYEPLLEVSTDKVDTEIPSPAAGIILKIYVPEGKTVERGVLLAVIGQVGEKLDDIGSPADAHNHSTHGNGAITRSVPEVQSATAVSTSTYTGHVTPVVARMVAEHRLDLAQIKGTGRDGRVTKKDVEAFLENPPAEVATPELAPWERPGTGDLFKPTVDYGEPSQQPNPQAAAKVIPPTSGSVSHLPQREGSGELITLTPMRRAVADHMVRSKLQTSPHVTTVFEIDLSAVMKHRGANKGQFAKQGVNLTLTAYFALATVASLHANSYLNAQWTDEGIYLHHVIHLGMAVALGDNASDNNGLIVPVIRNAQDLNLIGMARAVNDIAERARRKQLKPDEVQGGTFSITNHGVSGSLFATPIINQPQVGILGMGMMEQRVKVIDGMIAVRPCAYVSLTFDHRVVDGATGDAFMVTLKNLLEEWA